MVKDSKNFKIEEFSCKCGCGFNNVSADMVERLQRVREIYCNPIVITSGCRCKSHNSSVGGSEYSEHLRGLGCDISCVSSEERYVLIPLLLNEFIRIGIGPNFIHLGIDIFKHKNVMWVY